MNSKGGDMISETQKEIWIREAAARLANPKQRKTIDDDIEAIMAGVKFLMTNPEAKRLAHAVLDVAFEKWELANNLKSSQ